MCFMLLFGLVINLRKSPGRGCAAQPQGHAVTILKHRVCNFLTPRVILLAGEIYQIILWTLYQVTTF